MSYTPTTWATGDTVTAALLNKLEQGLATAIETETLITNAYQTTGTPDARGENIESIPWVDNAVASIPDGITYLAPFTVSAAGVTATFSGVTVDNIMDGTRVNGSVGAIKFNFTTPLAAVTFDFDTGGVLDPSTTYQVSVSAIKGRAPSEDFASAVRAVVNRM